MKIIIAGYGFVGTAVAHALSGSHQLIIVDPRYNQNHIKDHPDAQGVVVCVGTPAMESGDCDLNQITAVLNEVPQYQPVLIKSTIPPDRWEDLRMAYPNLRMTYSPEFLRAATATQDFMHQTYMILGGPDQELWKTVFEPCLPDCKSWIKTTPETASMVKYSINSFLSTKVAFFNHVYSLCEAQGVDYDTVKELIKLDPRLGDSHLQVPGPDGMRGFGGHCFPKDTRAFSAYSQRMKHDFDLLDTAIDYNTALRRPANP